MAGLDVEHHEVASDVLCVCVCVEVKCDVVQGSALKGAYVRLAYTPRPTLFTICTLVCMSRGDVYQNRMVW